MTSQLGLTDRIFSTAADRGLASDIETGLDSVEAGLLAEVRFADQIADATGRYLLNAGGKRVRPMLALLTAHLGDGAVSDVVTAATAIEITHLASLYHDDVMDDSDRRRGVPSAQTVWGNSVAILTGDLLFARASQLMARLGERAIRLQASTFERLVLGQLHETIGPQDGEDPVQHYIQVLADKTGSLIAAAAQAGIVFSGAPAEYETPLVEFGEKIGVAFQLIDDVIDLSPQPEETGKVPGTDLRAGVATLPLLRLRERAKTDASDAQLLAHLEGEVLGSAFGLNGMQATGPLPVTSAHGPTGPTTSVADQAGLGQAAAGQPAREPAPSEETINAAVVALREHKVTAQTLAEAHSWARAAVAALAPLPAGSVKKALTKFADTIVERSS
nr:polyprenyl synthetase family protein [Glaciibacter superstes]